MDVIARLQRCAIIAVVTLEDPAVAGRVVDSLAAGGVFCVEVTFRTAHAAAAIAAMRSGLPDALVGAGTILSIDAAAKAIDAGAEFLVAPGTNPSVVEYAQSRRLPILPGVATPTEIEANRARGLAVMKLFPAEILGGPAYLQSLAGPYPDIKFVPTGGVNEDNLARYLSAQNVLACGGTWIAPDSVIASEDWRAIERNAIRASEIVQRCRDGLAGIGKPTHSEA